MQFRNQHTVQDMSKYVNASGEKEIEDYEPRLSSDGVTKLVKKSTKRNIYNKIQESKDECDIYEIIRRSDPQMRLGIEQQIINANLTESDEVYDLTDVPKNLIQARQMLVDADKKFKSLPLEVRKEFNNNANEFLASAQKGELTQRIQKLYKKEETVDESTSRSVNNTNTDTSKQANKD